ncbi:MAG: NAD(P)H-hydrate dehydratase [Oscillospiraceae bacterium]|nr:NAD(P)H-hydrate dehydratase [Oscillospiraceae bacterium]
MDIWTAKSKNAIPLRDGMLTLPRRRADSHKGDYGRALLLGGSVGFTGAPCLCARAALRSGAGLVYLGVPAPIYEIVAVKLDEAMPFPLPAAGGGFDGSAAEALAEKLRVCDVAAIGPGMGRGEGGAALLSRLLRDWEKPLVIDADGLNDLAGHLELLDARRGLTTVLTPHDGEFLRLGGSPSGDRTADARRFAEAHGCCLILKGHGSLAAFPDGRVFCCTRGNPGMAKGGSGDALTGVLAAMLCQLPPERAVLTGLWLHSLAGDLARDRCGEYAMLAGDLIDCLPAATKLMLEDG